MYTENRARSASVMMRMYTLRLIENENHVDHVKILNLLKPLEPTV